MRKRERVRKREREEEIGGKVVTVRKEIEGERKIVREKQK